jgi:hemerythrin-like domain-containing protein
MTTWNLLSKLHQEIFRKIQLLEEASLDLLSKKIARNQKSRKLEADFVKFFRIGVIQHFKVEETALFPVLKRNFKEAQPIVSELISEHKLMVNRYFKLLNVRNSKLKNQKTSFFW